jgi:ABC-type Fe3+ transport system permease subunit
VEDLFHLFQGSFAYFELVVVFGIFCSFKGCFVSTDILRLSSTFWKSSVHFFISSPHFFISYALFELQFYISEQRKRRRAKRKRKRERGSESCARVFVCVLWTSAFLL